MPPPPLSPNNLRISEERRENDRLRANIRARCHKLPTALRASNKRILVRRQLNSHYPCHARPTLDTPATSKHRLKINDCTRATIRVCGVFTSGTERPERTSNLCRQMNFRYSCHCRTVDHRCITVRTLTLEATIQ